MKSMLNILTAGIPVHAVLFSSGSFPVADVRTGVISLTDAAGVVVFVGSCLAAAFLAAFIIALLNIALGQDAASYPEGHPGTWHVPVKGTHAAADRLSIRVCRRRALRPCNAECPRHFVLHESARYESADTEAIVPPLSASGHRHLATRQWPKTACSACWNLINTLATMPPSLIAGVPEYDWQHRPRLATGRHGAVSADHGRCSEMGERPACVDVRNAFALLLRWCALHPSQALVTLPCCSCKEPAEQDVMLSSTDTLRAQVWAS